MSNAQRPGLKSRAMPPPSTMRRGLNRAHTATPSMNGRASPADSIASSRVRSPAGSVACGKRKERDFDRDSGEGANINVVVRCRGRSDREVRENSGVVVRTDGLKGNYVELSMGPSALSNKTYTFDKVFSPAADQIMIFDEVVSPILDEVLSGFNCTIFAYGQTGTGKTYTMSGDISDTVPVPDSAGIIPRVLHSLFAKLDGDNESENSVKCSFIELYNEELRDLLSADDSVKLKIYEENNKKGHVTTMVQGMEESHIVSASKGIQLLREGSHKRQVAATKCNDLSSRSHTIFTITVYMKRTADTGEEFVSTGKLNLVDLAGSENIQRSGAENKRATEAGLINKSLLTLGRVINALVDRSSHIPYRESKLTRLLQDSLGGPTKTCIIATLSPARSNLEETISTLDYAFRAKNIRNKPQVNAMVSKKTMLKEFTHEIEKLKSELIATRQRNGVYLTQEAYDELTMENESRRILTDEQRDKILAMEINLRNKVQELFTLTTNFNNLKKDNEMTKMMLDGTKTILEKTEAVLDHTRRNLADETALRKAHQETEENLYAVGTDLLSTLSRTTTDIDALHSKLRRRSHLHSANRQHWSSAQSQVSNTTRLVEDRLSALQEHQENLIESLTQRMQTFVQDELQKLKDSQEMLQEKARAFGKSHAEVNSQTAKSRDDVNGVLEEIKLLREEVKTKVGAGLNDLSAAAERISAGILTEIDAFHAQLHTSYASLGKDFKTTFDDLVRRLNEQQSEAEKLQDQIVKANEELALRNNEAEARLAALIEEEQQQQATEREALMSQISALINSTAKKQQDRVATALSSVRCQMDQSRAAHGQVHEAFITGSQSWSAQAQALVSSVVESRESVKTKIKSDFAVANTNTESLRSVTKSVHNSTVQTVKEQMQHLDTQLMGLDEIVSRIQEHNNTHHEAHSASLAILSSDVQASYKNIGEHFQTSFVRIEELDSDMAERASALQETLPSLGAGSDIREPLSSLRAELEADALEEYKITGQTPQRTQYNYPRKLPRTEQHEVILAKLHGSPLGSPSKRSPTKAPVFTDSSSDLSAASHSATSSGGATTPGLREVDINIVAAPADVQSSTADKDGLGALGMPPLKRQHPNSGSDSKLPGPKKRATRMTVAGSAAEKLASGERENLTVDLSRSVGAGAIHPGIGRRLRSHNSG
ncbi:uncharacterized protein PV09_06993 [Verruconis gallopava]|uniref:Kinesin motor domain-containing protein n=1 Tax=Verruconis gallopava TaxID=253628 RepID=A0A0D2A4X6_9PEZI|nr:uncharacterized protein PV09_06993 [Verruconis gallopava]KIW01515.1 hypothetical protein PV09_06993 [Verruconis gallopava]